MYVPPPYAQTDAAALLSLVQAYPFATIAINGADGPLLAHAPLAAEMSADGEIRSLIGHVARANPFWRAADAGGAAAVALFSGPDGYVSPGFYPSKLEHGRVVPTWAYARIEARGVLRVETDPARLRPYVDAPTALMEDGRAAPWSADDTQSDYIATLLGRIVGLRIDITSVAGSWKLDQKKSAADRAGSAAGLRAEGKSDIASLIESALVWSDMERKVT